MQLGPRQEIVKKALVAFEVQLRRRNVEGAVALFCEDGVLFGSEEYENAIGTDVLGVFFSRLLLKALLGATGPEMTPTRG